MLALDDFLLAPMKDAERRDLLEVLEDCYACSGAGIDVRIPPERLLECSGTRIKAWISP